MSVNFQIYFVDFDLCFYRQSGEEKVRIERAGNCPVWTMSWNPSK